MIRNEKTPTVYYNQKFADQVSENGWTLLSYSESGGSAASACNATLESDDETSDEPSLEYDSPFKARSSDLIKEFTVKAGDFLILDSYGNEYGKTRSVAGIAALALKVAAEAEKREEKQAAILTKAEKNVEKEDKKAALREFEKIAKARHYGEAWESAKATYEGMLEDAVSDLEDAVEAGDAKAIEAISATYGAPLKRAVKIALELVKKAPVTEDVAK